MKTNPTVCLAILVGLALIVSHPVVAQRGAAQRGAAQVENVKLVEDERLIHTQSVTDEEMIRTLVDRQNRGEQALKGTDAFVVESGTAPQPPAPVLHERIARLVVSQSGELAYEYGEYTLGLVAPDSKAESFDGSYLRVWRKDNGEWLVDAAFLRP